MERGVSGSLQKNLVTDRISRSSARLCVAECHFIRYVSRVCGLKHKVAALAKICFKTLLQVYSSIRFFCFGVLLQVNHVTKVQRDTKSRQSL